MGNCIKCGVNTSLVCEKCALKLQNKYDALIKTYEELNAVLQKQNSGLINILAAYGHRPSIEIMQQSGRAGRMKEEVPE